MQQDISFLLYIDLISQGGLLIQVIIGGLLSMTIFLGMWWNKTVSFAHRLWTMRLYLKRTHDK